ncbi:MAG: signal peptidase I [Clostridiales bacterium]|nr:signal peptidase I [Clostridiales bacterium]
MSDGQINVPQQPQELEAEVKLAEQDNKKKQKAKKEKKKKTVGQEILSWVWLLLIAVVIAGLIRFFIFEPVRVQGRSMQETLQDGEVMLVTKPEVLLGKLQRGDVVIVRFPGRNSTTSISLGAPLDVGLTSHTLFVKRLVALPGDAVALMNGQLYVNDKPVEENYITHRSSDNYPRTVLGDNQYFVMGDNRANSHDSRAADVGPLTKDMIVGHPKLVLLPLNKIRIIK